MLLVTDCELLSNFVVLCQGVDELKGKACFSDSCSSGDCDCGATRVFAFYIAEKSLHLGLCNDKGFKGAVLEGCHFGGEGVVTWCYRGGGGVW